MGRAPCCDKANVKKGPWSPEEDEKLKEYIQKNGIGGNWIALPHKVGLRRCGKSCRLRWLNYLRPNIKHGEFSDEEDRIICCLFSTIGSRWSIIASQLPGRTDNDIKNYWNTKLKKKLMAMATSPSNQYQNRPNNQSTKLYQLPSNTSFLQNSASMASPYSSLLSHECTNTSLSGVYEPIPSNLTALVSSSSTTVNGFINSVHGNYSQVNNFDKNNLLMFGGEASCSSSDGSCIPSKNGHVKVVEHDYRFSNGDQSLCLQGHFNNGVENLKFLFSTNTDGYSTSTSAAAAAAYGCLSENPHDYYSTIEEIKELISTNNICTNNVNLFVDDIKTEEQVLDY